MKNLLIILILSCSFSSFAQTGIGTTTPNASAQLDVSSTTKGFLPPRMTAAQRVLIATPATGLLVYQIDGATGYYFYTGVVWQLLNTLDATTSATGKIQLAGDLAGTAALPVIGNAKVTNVKVASGIDAVKLANGSVSNTELQYINSLSSNVQTQLDEIEPLATADQIAIEVPYDNTASALAATTVQAGIDEVIAQKGVASGIASLGTDGIVPDAQLPVVVPSGLSQVANLAALPGTGKSGITYCTIDNGKLFRWDGTSAYVEVSPDTVLSVAGKTGVVTLVKADVGLGNVDNTTDLLKPISTATQTALNGKVDDGQVLTNVPLGAVFTDTTDLTGSNTLGSISTDTQTINGVATFNDGLSIPDLDKITVGTGGDLEIYHDGASDSYIKAPTGILNLQANDLKLIGTNSEIYFRGVVNSSAYMYWNNISKLETTSTGVTVTGTATATSVVADILLGTTERIYGGTRTNNSQYYAGDTFYHFHNGYQRLTMADTYTRFNVNQVDTDFIVSSVATNGMFKVDAATNTVGINTSSPNASYVLDVAGAALLEGSVDITGTTSHAGYTKLGEAAPAIKTVMYTGTTGATEGAAIQLNMAEVRNHKIISITVLVEYGDGAVVPQNFTDTNLTGYEYKWRTSNYYFLIYNHPTNSQNILSKTWTAYVTYGL